MKIPAPKTAKYKYFCRYFWIKNNTNIGKTRNVSHTRSTFLILNIRYFNISSLYWLKTYPNIVKFYFICG